MPTEVTMPTRPLQRGLYLITPDERDPSRFLECIKPLLPYASCLQLRNKVMDAASLFHAGSRLRKMCAEEDVTFITNNDANLAHALGADGVHSSELDSNMTDARRLLGDSAIIGVSCCGDLGRAREAVAAGANYVSFGACFPSPTKPAARLASHDLFRQAACLSVPRVAIGGITPDNAGSLIANGAEMIAAISGVFNAPDPVAAARAYLSCFEDPRHES